MAQDQYQDADENDDSGVDHHGDEQEYPIHYCRCPALHFYNYLYALEVEGPSIQIVEEDKDGEDGKGGPDQ